AIVPFFSDLTPFARSCVKGMRVVKRALPYEKEFDRCEWSAAFAYLANDVCLRTLSLGVVAGKPGPQGWEGVVGYSKHDFRTVQEQDDMQWIQEIVNVRSVKAIDVKGVIEHCPPPMSMAMARYIKFSASVDVGFGEFLKEEMVR
ncbi:hypothetical protein LTR28_004598, partial [Elasticomyces elasticus]